MTPPAPRLKAPIVLTHGILGFDFVRLAGQTLFAYFPGIPEALSSAGTPVRVARVSATAGVAQRAADLKAFLDREFPGEAVHLFAHSMGGLDARYLISRLGMADRVLSLTTIGTPHHGSPLADWSLRRVVPLLKPWFALLRLSWQAVPDLTVAGCGEFNAAVPDAPQVRYFSVAGRLEPSWRKWHFHLPERYIHKREGPNDGLVSVASAAYGEATDVWDGDHLDLVNWRSPVPFQRRGGQADYVAAYVALARRLADLGF